MNIKKKQKHNKKMKIPLDTNMNFPNNFGNNQ
jgi:hypothetical protein